MSGNSYPVRDENAQEAERIAHALKDYEFRASVGARITFSEIMAIHNGNMPVALVEEVEEIECEPRKYGALES